MGDSGKVAGGTGCTANVVLITKNKYFIANAGDSRSALSRNGKLVVFSEDHKPESKI
jgi:serine/threonine protein phosphatase PrpC